MGSLAPESLSHHVMGVVSDVPLFNKEKHVVYWLRCLRSPLPTAYTSNEANRMTLVFFIFSALDILGVLFKRTSEDERRGYIDWIYSCQHAGGGFSSFPPPHADPNVTPSGLHHEWAPPNMSATWFALSSLAVLGDDLSRVRRAVTLRWLHTMQDEDGLFGELLTPEGKTHGGKDTRYAYFAASIRWYLRDSSPAHNTSPVPDIDLAKLMSHIRSAQTYDGGIAGIGFDEAHAGLSYCAISALTLLGFVEGSPLQLFTDRDPAAGTVIDQDAAARWLSGRLTTMIDEDEADALSDDGSIDENPLRNPADSAHPALTREAEKYLAYARSIPVDERNGIPPLLDLLGMAPFIERGMFPVHWTGFNGRCNKMADTCYAFWASASLKMLDGLHFLDLPHVQCYLLEKTQHLIAGGFGKMPGDPPDIYHAYLGLATLAIINGSRDDGATIGPDIEDAYDEPPAHDAVPAARSGDVRSQSGLTVTRKGDTDRTIRELDPALCISRSARTWVESLEWRSTPV